MTQQTPTPTMLYPFTEDEMEQAAHEWGCNCGPSALAFVLQKPLAVARHAIPEFESKRYTSPSMMHTALQSLGAKYRAYPNLAMDKAAMFNEAPALVRVQWTGLWTGKWAYWYTHWIVCWIEATLDNQQLVFDCNGGARGFVSWEAEIVPLLLPKRGDGGWHPTHIWRIDQ